MSKQLSPFLLAVLMSMVGVKTYAQSSQTKRTIHVEVAGTLPNLISEEDKYQIEELTLTGELNGSDIKFLWDMSGTTWSYLKYEDKYYYEVDSEGKLKVLDITDTKIVEGGGWYFTWDYDERSRAHYTSNNTISENMFRGCRTLTSIKLPNSVTSIRKHAFYGCSGLTSIKIPNSVTSIEEYAFPCSLISINVESGNHNYDSRNNCNAIIETKSNKLIAGCKSTIIPNSVTGIGSGAFDGCSSLTSITIPNSVTSIGSGAFSGCSGLTSIFVESGNTKYDSRDNCNGIIETQSNTLITGCQNTIIPSSVISIEKYAFDGCSGLTSVTIPNSVTGIGWFAFSGCKSLTSIVSQINDPFVISDYVFDYVIYSTATLTVPYGTKSLYEATDGWKKFQNIVESPSPKRTIHVATAGTLPDLISEDEKYEIEELTLTGELNGRDLGFLRMMAGCPNYYIHSRGIDTDINYGRKTEGKLMVLDLSGVNIVSGGAYLEYDPDGPIQMYYSQSNIIPTYVFMGCEKLVSVALPSTVITIGDKAFSGCSSLTSVTIPNSVTTIGSSAFSDCTSLMSASIPNRVTFIGDGAFFGTGWYMNQANGLLYLDKWLLGYKGDRPVGELKIVEGTKGIANNAFSGCSDLTSVTIPNSVTSIGNSAFNGCNGLTSVTIPSSVTSIGDGTFFGCSGLTSVTIPNSVTSIGNSAFNGCNGLTSVTIPSSVTSIGDGTFFGCSGLTSVTIPNSVTSIGNSAFNGCSGLTSVIIPNCVTSIGYYAFYGCSGLKKVVSKIKEPFKIDNTVFSGLPSDAELIVPAGTKSLYEATEGWNQFSKITEHIPTLETQPAQPTSTTKARLIALADEDDDDQHFGFEWLRYDAPADMPANKVSAPLYDRRIIGSLGGLNPDIYYKYRPFYKSDSGEMVYGEWIPFLTGDANVFFEPETHTKEADRVTATGAHLSGVWIEGTDDIQEKGFEYWTISRSNTRAVGTDVKKVTVSGNDMTATLDGLQAGKEYGYRSYAKTTTGKTTYGEEKTFKTILIGDVNGDGELTKADIEAIASHIIGKTPAGFNKKMADLNDDTIINAADIVLLVNLLPK